MPAIERTVDMATRRSREQTARIGQEIRDARLGHGLSQRDVARHARIDQSTVSRIERALYPRPQVVVLARLLAVLGLELSLKAYPAGHPLRDAAHLALLDRLCSRLSPRLSWQAEVPLANASDRRAWDACIWASGLAIGVEVETRVRDLQALERRLALKKRDGAVASVLLLLADTRWNRSIVRLHEIHLSEVFPVPGRAALQALAAGRAPGGDSIVLL
jgi:transcriptional regulator with XRE-family HTH domain